MLEGLGLATLDEEASPESARTAEKQVDLRLKLSAYMQDIEATFKGDEEDLKLPREAGAPVEEQVGQATELALYAAMSADVPTGQAIVEEGLTESEREEASTSRLRDKLRGTSATTHDGERIQPPVGAIIRRDLLWTASIALVTSVAYIPTIYNPAWGTTADYVSAFAAGFLGKVAINWAAMPLFQSLRAGKSGKPAAAEESKPAAAVEKPATAGS
jgi:hypothetical protein